MRRLKWQKCRVFWPVKTLGGRWVWRRDVERAFDENGGMYWGDFSGHAGNDGGYRYRLPLFVAPKKNADGEISRTRVSD